LCLFWDLPPVALITRASSVCRDIIDAYVGGNKTDVQIEQEQLHEREKYILELEMKLDDTHRELDALKIDHQTVGGLIFHVTQMFTLSADVFNRHLCSFWQVWANQDLLREQTKELASFR
jgi:hypothetical protein